MSGYLPQYKKFQPPPLERPTGKKKRCPKGKKINSLRDWMKLILKDFQMVRPRVMPKDSQIQKLKTIDYLMDLNSQKSRDLPRAKPMLSW